MPALNLPRSGVTKVRLRLMNLSPETDGSVSWRASDDPAVERKATFALRPYCHEWQEIVCPLNETPWAGDLQKLRVTLGINGVSGDISVDWIAVTDGTPRVRPARPAITPCARSGPLHKSNFQL